jgi:putative flippase GtrA
MREHVCRFVKFGMVGGTVFAMSLTLVYLCVTVWGFNPTVSYLASGAIAICINFALNRRFTWNGNDKGLWESAWRSTILRIASIGLETVLFTVLMHHSVNTQLAQIGAVIVACVVNYAATHLWVYASETPRQFAVQESIPQATNMALAA